MSEPTVTISRSLFDKMAQCLVVEMPRIQADRGDDARVARRRLTTEEFLELHELGQV